MCDRHHHLVWIAGGSQLDKANAVGKEASEFGGKLEAQTRFTDATRSKQREEAYLWAHQQNTNISNILLASNQRRQNCWHLPDWPGSSRADVLVIFQVF